MDRRVLALDSTPVSAFSVGSVVKTVQALNPAGAFGGHPVEAGWEGRVQSIGEEDALVEFKSPPLKLHIHKSDFGKFAVQGAGQSEQATPRRQPLMSARRRTLKLRLAPRTAPKQGQLQSVARRQSLGKARRTCG